MARARVLRPRAFLVDDSRGAARFDVCADPEARQRRQVVGGRRDQRLHGILVAAAEFAAPVLLEVEQPVAQHAEARQRLAHRRLHRAQILADHDHLVAHAFQRQDADQVVRAAR